MGRSCTKCDKKHYAKGLCKNHYESSDEYKYKQREYYKKPENKKKKAIVNSRHYKKNRDTLLPKMRERYHNLTPEQIESERLRGKQRTANGEHKDYHEVSLILFVQA